MRALYDVVKDPWQSQNLIDEQSGRAAGLVRVFESFAQTQTTVPLDFVDANYEPTARRELPRREMSEETRRELRALGYVR
jgi:hypothetical protein